MATSGRTLHLGPQMGAFHDRQPLRVATTNSTESLNYQRRQIIKNRGHAGTATIAWLWPTDSDRRKCEPVREDPR